jgi:alpha-beta hydrolase superfamily lysophospholipase
MQNWKNGEFIEIDGGRHDLLCETENVRRITLDGIVDLFNKTTA